MKTATSMLATVATTLFGTFVALGLLEIGVRVFLSSQESQKPAWSDRPPFYFRATGEPRMRGLPYNPKKPAGTFRIAVVGDSFTFGPYMQFTDTFPFKLQQMLRATSGERNIEVINYGVPAYSTSHEVLTTRTAIEQGADLIILQITLNDPQIKTRRPAGISEHRIDHFGPLKLKGSLKTLAQRWKTLDFVLNRLHNTRTHQAYVRYFSDLFDNPTTWDPFVESMTTLVSSAKAAKIPIVAVVFPLFGIPMDENYPFYDAHRKVKALMGSLKTPLYDISGIYKGIPLEHLQVIPGVDRHPNEIAHRMAAEHIYLWLEKRALIPKEFLIEEKYATRLGIRKQRRLKSRVPGAQFNKKGGNYDTPTTHASRVGAASSNVDSVALP